MLLTTLLALVGLILYFVLTNQKGAEAAKWLYVCALLATLFHLAGRQLRLPW